MPTITLSTTNLRTAKQLMNCVLGEIGLPLTNSVVSTDQTVIQLLYLMNALGENLAKFPLWADLRSEFLITTTTADAYDLPVDWNVPLNGTSWDRTGRWPLLGPKTPTEWQYLKSGFGVAAPQYRYRYYNRQFNLFPAPIEGLTLVQEYLSSSWVLGLDPSGLTASVGKPRITLDTDYILLDERMFIEGAKLAFLEAKGLDSSKAFRNFTDMMEAAWADSNGAPVLSMAPIPANIFITEWNAPDTGYGT
jgi:hypothetical protein